MSHYKPYPAYKDSGVEWIGQVPEHWLIRPIKGIVSTPITDGPHETPQFYDHGVPFVSAEAISDGFLNFEKIRGYISREAHEVYLKKYKPQKNDIFMIKSGATTGVTAIVDTDIEFNIWSPLAVIRCNDAMNSFFVLNYMRSHSFQEGVSQNWSFGTQQNIGMGVIGDLHVTAPPLDEQKAIANYLDRETTRIDDLIAKKTRFIELLKEKRSALITHAVTKGLDPNVKMKDSGVEWIGEVPEHWRLIRLGMVGSLVKANGGNKQDDADTGVPCIRYGDIYTTYDLQIHNIKKFIKPDAEQDYTSIHYGDILFAASGETFEEIGKSVVNLSQSSACCGGDIIIR